MVVVWIGRKYGLEGEPCASPTGLGGSVPLRVPQTPLPPKRGGSPWSGVRHGCPSHSLRAYVGVPVSGTCCIVRVQENVGGGESCKWRGCTRASKRASSRRGYQSPPSVPRQTPSTASDVPHTPGINRLINATCKGGVPTLKCNVTSKSMVSEMTIKYISTECTHETLVHRHLSVHHRRNIGVEPHLSWPQVPISSWMSKSKRAALANRTMLLRNWLSYQMLLLRHLQPQPASSPSGITMTRSQ